jgi:hypothetical protein
MSKETEKEEIVGQFFDKTDKVWYLCKKDKQIIICKSAEELIEDREKTEKIDFVVINQFKKEKEKKENSKDNDTEKTTFTVCVDTNGNSILLRGSNKLK